MTVKQNLFYRSVSTRIIWKLRDLTLTHITLDFKLLLFLNSLTSLHFILRYSFIAEIRFLKFLEVAVYRSLAVKKFSVVTKSF